MKQFIRYLYEYDNGKRIRNIGFVKVEQSSDECTIHIHGKGLRLENKKDIRLYIFYKQGDTCVGIPQGEIENVNPAINYRLAFTPDDVGGKERFSDIAGIILANFTRPRYAAVWSDMPADIENMIIEERKPARREPSARQPESRDKAMEKAAEGLAEPAGKKGATEETAAVPEPVTEAVREPAAEPVGEPVGEPAGEAYQEPQENYAVVQESVQQEPEKTEAVSQEQQKTPSYKKISREEIAQLPRREWKLANNSFLLHGYYNYHHLMLIEYNGALWLGVPGVFHEKESMAAQAFGFPQFIRIPAEQMNLTPDEINEGSDFGYWSRQVSRYEK